MSTQKIRRQFLNYFQERGHTIVPSSPVVPHDDPSLLFINAGMNQFKDVFLGKAARDYSRAVSAQKCIRVGGKHNDLENVGHTSRHLTFFEMMGNFSFGDYFKEQAIKYAWEVSITVFGFDPDRIWPTVFREDDAAFEIWRGYVPAERITRFDEKDNFWMMGETGPCGPCSELLYDRGSLFGQGKRPIEDPEGERFIEFWNLVFMQDNCGPSGERQPLPRPSIDTGAGLERVMALKMGVESVFETDVLRGLIGQVEFLTGVPYEQSSQNSSAFRVIADHLRCLAFAIADGVQPSNVDRGYVLRKVLRRATRYGRMLGMDRPFLAELLPQLMDSMGSDYPELAKAKERIAEVLTVEEEAFIRTLRRGGNILNQVVERAQASSEHRITGDDAFKLKDTYGLPIEEVLLIARDSNVTVDEQRYRQLEEEARQRSRSVQKNVHQMAEENVYADFARQHGESVFVGYEQECCESKVVGLMAEGVFVSALQEGEKGVVILDKTPFYPEMGGQVGDTGCLVGDSQSFTVQDCQSPYKGVVTHAGVMLKGTIRVGDKIRAEIDHERRLRIKNNHTATHLLHWALNLVLGEHIKQAGSVVDPERLRFDFSHHKALSMKEIRQIEDLVNEKIRENVPVKTYELKFQDVQKREDIKQFFGEKYGMLVRVVDIDFSKELCGGTHTSAAGTIGYFRILKEGSIAAGIRRIEAVSGKEAEEFSREQENALLDAAQTLKVPVPQVQERLERLLEENRGLEQEVKSLRTVQLERLVESLMYQISENGGLKFIAAEVSLTMEELRQAVDMASQRLASGIVALGTVLPEKCQLLIKVSEDWIKKGFSANDLIKLAMPIVEGNGGGKAQFAQGGGKASHRLIEALEAIKQALFNKTIP